MASVGGMERVRQPSLRNLQPQEVSVSRSKSPPAGMGTVASPPPSKASTLTAALLAGWDGRGLRERRKCPTRHTTSPGGAAPWRGWMPQTPSQAPNPACSQCAQATAGVSGHSCVSASAASSARSRVL